MTGASSVGTTSGVVLSAAGASSPPVAVAAAGVGRVVETGTGTGSRERVGSAAEVVAPAVTASSTAAAA
jgi:hypothetical protein